MRKLIRLCRFWVAAVLLMCTGAGSALAQGVAMVLDRTGEAELLHAGKTARLNVLDYLAPDAELRLGGGAGATLVYLATSQEWQFAGPGRYRLQAGQPTVLQGAAPRSRGLPAPSGQAMAKLEPAQRERMTQGAVVMRSSGLLRIVSPNNVDVLAAPVLLWKAPPESAVRISVIQADSQSLVAQTTTMAQQWAAPPTLPAGSYLWRVELTGDTPGLPRSGRFRLLGSSDERAARLGNTPSGFAQRVAHAVLLESEDLPHDALVLWRALAAERPEEESLKAWAP